MRSPARTGPKPRIALLLAAFSLGGCGGSLEEEPPPQIPAPETPTDLRETRRVEAALAAYRRDTRLIAQERAACARGLPPGLFASVCGPDITPLTDQRAFLVRSSLGKVKDRLGPRCERAVQAVLAQPVAEARPALEAAARACRAEYETARERG